MQPSPLSVDLHHILDHTRDLWKDLRGARLFITGGTGFFGSWLLESFLFANRQLDLKSSASVLTRRPDFAKQALPHLLLDPAVSLIEGDARTFEFPKGKFSHIIHAATETSPQMEFIEPLDKFTANVDGIRRVLDFALVAGASNFLFTSSGAVYGKQPSDMTHVPEDYVGAPHPNDVDTVYGQSKRVAEFLCAAYAKKYGFQAAIARGFAFVGPRIAMDANYAIGNFIRDAMQQKPIQISGDGTPRRSYLYAADLAIWLWTILLRGQSCRPYNVGSANDLSIAELAQVVATVISPGAKISIASQSVAGQLVARYVPSTRRAKTELGLDAWIPLEESIRRTAKFHSR